MFYYVEPCCSCGQFRFETGSCHSDLISIFLTVLYFPLYNILVFWKCSENVEPWCWCGRPSSHNFSILFAPSPCHLFYSLCTIFTHILWQVEPWCSCGRPRFESCLHHFSIISSPLYNIFFNSKDKKMLFSRVPNMFTFANWPMWIGADNGSYEFYGWHFCFYMTCLVAAMQIEAWSYSTS